MTGILGEHTWVQVLWPSTATTDVSEVLAWHKKQRAIAHSSLNLADFQKRLGADLQPALGADLAAVEYLDHFRAVEQPKGHPQVSSVGERLGLAFAGSLIGAAVALSSTPDNLDAWLPAFCQSDCARAIGTEEHATQKQAFATAFRADPEVAVEWFVRSLARRGEGLLAARLFLPYLVRASYAQQNLFLGAVLRTSSPEDVVSAAFLAPAEGSEEVLEAASEVLEHYGRRAWESLAAIAMQPGPKSRYFVRTIGAVPAPTKEKVQALASLAKHQDPDVRWLVASVADDVGAEASEAVWQVLLDDNDEQLREAARQRVSTVNE